MARDDDTQINRRKFGIEKRINLGDLIQIGLIAGGGLWFIVTMHTDIAVLSANVQSVQNDVGDIRKSIDRSVSTINRRIDEVVDGHR